MSTVPIYLDLADDVRLLLEQNGVSIESVLADQGIEQTVTYRPLPYAEEGGTRGKELVLVIIAASAGVLAVCHAVSQVLSTLQDRAQIVEIDALEEVRDADGQVLLDTQGQPILKPVKRVELLERAAKNTQRELEIEAGLSNGLVIRVKSADAAASQRKGT